MHTTTLIDTDAPRLEIPAAGAIRGPRRRDTASTLGLEFPAEDVIPDLAFILGLVYLDAGLPPEAALRSALADYECSFSGIEMGSL